jgi:CheY-like chemotaxis protein
MRRWQLLAMLKRHHRLMTASDRLSHAQVGMIAGKAKQVAREDIADLLLSQQISTAEGERDGAMPETATGQQQTGYHHGMKTVLIVSGDEPFAKLLAEMLANGGYRSAIAFDGRDGLRRVREDKLEMIIVNPGFPDMSGAEFARAMREDPALRSMPVVFIGGGPGVSGNLEVGVGFIRQPFTVDGFLRAIAAKIGPATE